MNEFETDRLLEALDVRVDPAVEGRVWQTSSRALRRRSGLRKLARGMGSAAAMAALCAGAFFAGQRSGGADAGLSMQAHAGDRETVTITVDREFLEWVDAGRFFAQLEMEEKAAEAYERAIRMIPEEAVRPIESEAAGDRVAGAWPDDQLGIRNAGERPFQTVAPSGLFY